MLRRRRRYPVVLYACALLLAGLTAFAVTAAYLASDEASIGSWLLGIALTLLPASILSITFVNWLVTQIVPPRVLPTPEFKKGNPKDCATTSALPALVANAPAIPSPLPRTAAHPTPHPHPHLPFVLF